MILADKIAKLRKKNGWSQEELAEKMNVSRQAVSKWESAQTIPDLGKILQLGNLFGVTTDYLLKDEIEDEEFIGDALDTAVKKVSLAEANSFIAHRKWASFRISIATFMCILSPVALFFLAGASETGVLPVSEESAALYGLLALFLIVVSAVALFVHCGFQNAPYKYLDDEAPFELEYGVRGMILEKKKAFRHTYTRSNIIATCLCVVSPIPLIASAFTHNEFLVITMLAVTMLLAAIGVFLFILNGVQWASMQKLLREGEYSPKGLKRSRVKEAIARIYWISLTAIYLGWSFAANAWKISWIVFLLGGLLFAAVMALCDVFIDKD